MTGRKCQFDVQPHAFFVKVKSRITIDISGVNPFVAYVTSYLVILYYYYKTFTSFILFSTF